jgi:outer membrane protein OmpA-like peptidoglycan-associated protein
MKRLFKYLIIALMVIIGKMTWADEVIMYLDQVPTAEELAGTLFPEQVSGQPVRVKTRSLQFGKKIKPSESTGVGMPIQFDSNSAEIKEVSKPFLNQIGMMLNMEKLANQKLMIEGHTDAYGPNEYNDILSERRAAAVKDYLVSGFNISSKRILISGKGETKALPGRGPNDPMNRRVQFYKAQ